MKTDLVAAELFNALSDLWPFYGQNHLLAQLHVEDAVNRQVRQERERFQKMLLTHIHLLERRGGAYGKTAANHLTIVLKELNSEEERDLDKEEEKQFFKEADESQDEFRRRSFGEGL